MLKPGLMLSLGGHKAPPNSLLKSIGSSPMVGCRNICVRNGYGKDASTYHPVLIIGADATGLALAC